jgi:nitronate monooxygenase
MVTGWPDRRLIDLFGIEAPILLAPMAGAGGVELAVAAMAGGALGSLPCAMLTPEQVREQVAAVRGRSQAPLNLNFFCHKPAPAPAQSRWLAALEPYYREYGVGLPAEPPPLRAPFSDAMCAIVEETRPELVSFHFGLPDAPLLDRVRASAAKIIASATTVAEARWLDARGVDAVIAQGFEAGGHAGRFLPADPAAQMGLFALLPQIVDAVAVPVIAAGGIADARGVTAAFALGAAGVQIGTAYLHCPESLIGPGHRAALTSEDAERTVFTNLISGGFARGVPNRLIEELGPVSPDAPPFPHATAALAELRKAAEARGRTDFTPLWSGQTARLARPIGAREFTQRLISEALALLTQRASAPILAP